MAEQALKEKVTKGLFWGGISNGIQQLLGVIIGVVLLKNLTPDDYGLVGMLAIFTAIAITIQESGFTAALTNRTEFKSEDYNAVFWFNLFVGSIIYILLFFSAPYIAEFYGQPELVVLSRVSFLSILIGSFGIAHNAVLFRNLMVKEKAKIDIISTFISGVLGIYLAIKGLGYWALIVQTLLASIVGTILRWYFSSWKPSFSFKFSPIKEMFGFGSKMLLSSIISQVQSNIFSVLLGRFYTKADVGYFSQGVKWAGMGSQVMNGMIYSVAQPIFSKVKGDKERETQILRKLLRFISFVTFPVLLGLAFVSEDFIRVVNEDFLPSVPILQIYCIWGCVFIYYSLFIQILVTYGQSNFYFIYTLLTSLIQIGIAFLIYSYGIYWLAIANLFVFILFFFVLYFFVIKFVYISFCHLLKDIIPFLVILLLSLLFAWFVTVNIHNMYFKIILKIVVVAIVYLVLMYYSSSVIFKDILAFVINKIK